MTTKNIYSALIPVSSSHVAWTQWWHV